MRRSAAKGTPTRQEHIAIPGTRSVSSLPRRQRTMPASYTDKLAEYWLANRPVKAGKLPFVRMSPYTQLRGTVSSRSAESERLFRHSLNGIPDNFGTNSSVRGIALSGWRLANCKMEGPLGRLEGFQYGKFRRIGGIFLMRLRRIMNNAWSKYFRLGDFWGVRMRPGNLIIFWKVRQHYQVPCHRHH